LANLQYIDIMFYTEGVISIDNKLDDSTEFNKSTSETEVIQEIGIVVGTCYGFLFEGVDNDYDEEYAGYI
jgi:sulfur relay (sulfurtransferase) complex TusBCD TusD component (DsrE family)